MLKMICIGLDYVLKVIHNVLSIQKSKPIMTNFILQ